MWWLLANQTKNIIICFILNFVLDFDDINICYNFDFLTTQISFLLTQLLFYMTYHDQIFVDLQLCHFVSKVSLQILMRFFLLFQEIIDLNKLNKYKFTCKSVKYMYIIVLFHISTLQSTIDVLFYSTISSPVLPKLSSFLYIPLL